MFLHNLFYDLKTSLRTKDLIIWLMVFPLALGAFFKFAFDSIYEETTKFSTVDVAVVDEAGDKAFRAVADGMAASDEPLLNVTYADREEALELLKKEEVKGIIFTGDELTLSVGYSDIEQAVLKSFVEEYNLRIRMIERAAAQDPAAAMKAAALISEKVSAVNEEPLTDGNPDYMVQYFYNLLAMVAMFGIMNGLHITEINQANISALGARKSCSPSPKLVSICSALTAAYIIQTVCMVLSVTYLRFILRVDFGSSLPLIYLTSALGGTVGVSMGFLIGSISFLSQKAKESLTVAFSLLLCFFSGLMVENMKMNIEQHIPWFNRINPAAVISDSFYCLNIYSDYSRYSEKVLTMAAFTVFFALLGFVFTRRKKYASL
ncbi:MAG: ABC transporter permease [Ruminococcus sp.]|nr:ABC transporter permease [Ruminococcus sp.]